MGKALVPYFSAQAIAAMGGHCILGNISVHYPHSPPEATAAPTHGEGTPCMLLTLAWIKTRVIAVTGYKF